MKEDEVRGHEFERKQGRYMEGLGGTKGENDANIFYFRMFNKKNLHKTRSIMDEGGAHEATSLSEKLLTVNGS